MTKIEIPEYWDEKDVIPPQEITENITDATVIFAERFGTYLGTDRQLPIGKSAGDKMTSSQLRRFFGEVKRQQISGYKRTDFILLKPKLAYAVGRAKPNNKIKDFYVIISKAIDLVHNEEQFKRFVSVFEAIVAYHKVAEENKTSYTND